jgi:phage baseplate assembly protein V
MTARTEGIEQIAIPDMERRIANMVRIGAIHEVDAANKRIRVRSGAITTGWIPWPAEIGRNYRRWRPLRTGQQVIMVSPCGDLSQAVVAGMLYTSALASPSSDEDLDIIEYEDGTVIKYDSGESLLTIDSVGDVVINCVGATLMCETAAVTASESVTVETANLNIEATTAHDGNVSVVGNLSVDGNFSAEGGTFTHNGKNVGNTHAHLGVTTGAGTSGGPV